MRRPIAILILALSAVLGLTQVGCGGGSWCADCEKSVAVLSLNYQASTTHPVGQSIPPNLPNPAGGTPEIYAVAAGTLPAGLSLNPTTGVISGTPTVPGVFTITIRATNQANAASQTLSITIVPAAPLGLGYATPLVVSTGTAIPMQNPNLSQATPGVTTSFQMVASSLPAGLNLDPATGAISGTPTVPGSTTFTVRATNGTRTALATATYVVTPSAALTLGYVTPQYFTTGSAIPVQNPVLGNATPGIATSYSVTTGILPPGLAIDAATGAVTGTPTTPGVYLFTVTAANGTRSAVAVLSYTVQVQLGFTVHYASQTFPISTPIPPQSPVLANATPGVVTVFTLTGGSLPPGLSLDPATGIISGTPSAFGTWTFTVTATNGTRTATSSPTYIIPPAASLSLSYVSPQVFTVGVAIAPQGPTVSNATPGVPTSFALVSGTLPPGLTFDPTTGVIAGTPTAPGSWTFVVTATNGNRTASATANFVVTYAEPMAIKYVWPLTWTAGTTITPQTPWLTYTTPGVPVSVVRSGGSLPPGLSIHPVTGVISGTPSVPGVFNFKVTATNGTRTATASVTYIVTSSAPLSVSYATPRVFTAGIAIPGQFPSLGNVTPGILTTFEISAGSLPPGLILDSRTGEIFGTPTTPGVFPFTIQAVNGSRRAPSSISYTVTPAAPLTLTYSTPQQFTEGTAIPAQSPVVGNATPGVATTFAISAGTLPGGLSLSAASGSITGTPTTPGVFPFTVTATNGTRSAAFAVAYTVVPSAPLTASYPTPQVFLAGSAIPAQAPSMGSTTPGVPTTFAVTGGSLPPGLGLDPVTGSITGTPTNPGVYAFTITATNGTRSATANVNYTVTPAAALTVSYPSPQTFTEGSAIPTQSPTVANETPGITTTFAVTAGSLPTGLTLNADGTITGTPTAPGVYAFTITASNGTRSATANVSYTVVPAGALTVSYPSPRSFTAGAAIATQSPTMTNETPGITTSFAVTAGSLPGGLTLNADGTITGTPSVPGVYAFTITATNGSRTATFNLTYTIEVAAALSVSYTTPQTFIQNSAIATQSPTLGNETPGVTTTFAVTAGSLPAGLVLNADGTITGTPTATGTSNFTITATNGTRTATANVSYTVNSAAPTGLAYSTPVTYTVGVAISANNPNPTGGTPTSYAVTSGALPAGLTLDPSTGVISGTPATPGSFTVTISASNGAGGTSQVLTITVLPAVLANLSANPPTVSVGQSTSLTPIFSGGTGAIDQGIGAVSSGGSLPVGPYGSVGTYTYTLTVTNGVGATATATAVVTVVAAPPYSVTFNVPTSGVTYTYPNPGDPLSGLQVVVPNQGGAVCASTDLTVTRMVGTPQPGALASGVVAVSDPWSFSSTVGYPFRKPMTVTLPYDGSGLGAADLPVPFFWDAAYSKWVAAGIKSVDTTNHLVTFTTLLPGVYSVLAIPGLSASLSNQSLGFAAGSDSWFQPNQGVFDVPGGSSYGMSSFAAWYFGMKKGSGSGLYSLFREGDVNSVADDVSARALISRLANGTLENWNSLWTQGSYGLTGVQTGLALITGLRASGQPQVFLMAEARPAAENATATLVTGYTQASGRFNVLDPNFPGMALTIAWNSGTGAFSSYDRASAYVPAFAQYAFEGQPSVHRLADYERVFDGANGAWPNPPFATLAVTDVGSTGPVAGGGTATVASSANVTVTGSVSNGSDTATHIYWSQNGGARTAVTLAGNNFNFTIPALSDPYGTRVALETTANPCDPSFSFTGYTEFNVKESGRSPWFPNICFESGSTNPWILEQGSNVGVGYPGSPSLVAGTGFLSGYGVTWSAGSIDSALVGVANDPNVTSISQVFDGTSAFRVNNPAIGAHISRIYQDIVIPNDVAVPKMTFYWAAVMQDPGHAPADQPFVDIVVQDLTSGQTVYFKHFYANDPSYPGWISGSGQWKGIAWQKVSLSNLTSRAGHTLRILVMAGDCTQTGHGGYAYLDGVNCN